MAVKLPESDLELIAHYCESETPDEMRDQARVEFRTRGSTVTIVECRPPWREDFGPEWTEQEMARMKFNAESLGWTLYWFDSNSKAHRYDQLQPHRPMKQLLDEIDRDPTGIFWG